MQQFSIYTRVRDPPSGGAGALHPAGGLMPHPQLLPHLPSDPGDATAPITFSIAQGVTMVTNFEGHIGEIIGILHLDSFGRPPS